MHECTDNEQTHINRALGLEHARELKCAVLGKYVRRATKAHSGTRIGGHNL